MRLGGEGGWKSSRKRKKKKEDWIEQKIKLGQREDSRKNLFQQGKA